MTSEATAPATLGHPSLRRPFFHCFSTGTMRTLFRTLTRTRLHGLEHIPPDGPLIVVSNHFAWVDPVMLGAYFPRPLIFMAKQELWRRRPVGWIVERYGAFPVRRGEADRGAIRAALGILDAGGALGIFPEGTRSRSGVLSGPHPGASLLALRSGAPVLPTAVVGTTAMSGFDWLGRWPQVDIYFGRTLGFAQQRGAGKDRLDEASATIMRRIADLLPMDRRGAFGSSS